MAEQKKSSYDQKFPRPYKKFILLDRAGKGGMAEVFRAVTLDEVNRVVIIKKSHRELRKDQSFVNMFRDEVRISAHLNHPNIVHVNSYGEKAQYIEMEYIRGITLRKVIDKLRKRRAVIP